MTRKMLAELMLLMIAAASYATVNVDLSEIIDARGNRIPDFSRVGYMGGDAAIPHVKTLITLYPEPDSKDDTARIQAALDKVAAAPADADGIRGAVMLEQGEYRVAGALKIHTGGVVLRGKGHGSDGSVITATGSSRQYVIHVGDTVAPWPRLFFLKQKGAKVKIRDKYIPVGGNSIRVENPGAFKPGDNIIISCPASEKFIKDIGMDNMGEKDGKLVRWKTSRFYQRFERTVVKVTPDAIILDVPLVEAINAEYGVGSVFKYRDDVRIRQCGVENLLVRSLYAHDTDEDHAWQAVVMDRVRDSWVSGIVAEHMARGCVLIEGNSRNITVQDSASIKHKSIISGGRRYAFVINGQMNLVQRCYAEGSRHAFATNARVRGPNVFLDCVAEETHSDIGPHMEWTVGTLYDNIIAPGGQIFVQNRGRAGGGHGWAGANEVLWNCVAGVIVCQSPPIATNYSIGCVGRKIPGVHVKNEKDGYWLSHNQPVSPRSLYIDQLVKRVGEAGALNVVNASQLSGGIAEAVIAAFRPKYLDVEYSKTQTKAEN